MSLGSFFTSGFYQRCHGQLLPQVALPFAAAVPPPSVSTQQRGTKPPLPAAQKLVPVAGSVSSAMTLIAALQK